jgi:hypothetical protein
LVQGSKFKVQRKFKVQGSKFKVRTGFGLELRLELALNLEP